MKWSCLIGILGLAIGFFVGRAQEKVVDDMGDSEVVRSDRRAKPRAGKSQEQRSRGARGMMGQRLVREAGVNGEPLGEVSRARLMKWILELEAADFPEILEKLKKLKSRGIDVPFSESSPNHEFLTVALARWYELEGESVLDWLVAKPDLLEEMGTGQLIEDLLKDGYEKDPGLSLLRLRKYAGFLKFSDRSSGLGILWRYQVGRWSRNLDADWAELQSLEKEFGQARHIADSFLSLEEFDGSFIRGMIDSGREQEAREVFRESEHESELMDAILETMTVEELEEKGWEEVKVAIDSGALKGRLWQAERVLEKWQDEAPEKAAEWFLAQSFDEITRADQIKKAAFSFVDYSENFWPGTGEEFDAGGMMRFLDQMVSDGEPAGQAWGGMMDAVLHNRQWDDLEKLKLRVTPELWERALDRVKFEAVDLESLDLGEGDSLHFMQVTAEGRDLISRFGVEEQVLQSVEIANEEALRKLQERLGFGAE